MTMKTLINQAKRMPLTSRWVVAPLLMALGLLMANVPAWADDRDEAHSGRLNPPLRLPALKEAAHITRDALGIAHINARNEHDLFFLQGYVHAQDRLFQMDMN